MSFLCDHSRRFIKHIDYDRYLEIHRQQLRTLLEIDFWNPHREMLSELDSVLRLSGQAELDIGQVVSTNAGNGSSDELTKQVAKLIQGLIPWRKGPFNLCGNEVHAEWRSDLKWDRISPILRDRKLGRVADVGCNNGYYMFRLLELDPELVVGFDPNARFYYQFDLVQRLCRAENLYFELLGIEHLDLFPNFFDTVICMGVVYHRRDFHGALKKLRESLRPGGLLVLESLGIDGADQMGLLPAGRYAKMNNVWIVPSAGGLKALLERAGFEDVKVESCTQVTPLEQRSTRFAPFESLIDYLDPDDSSKTVEGYPAPKRIICSARV